MLFSLFRCCPQILPNNSYQMSVSVPCVTDRTDMCISGNPCQPRFSAFWRSLTTQVFSVNSFASFPISISPYSYLSQPQLMSNKFACHVVFRYYYSNWTSPGVTLTPLCQHRSIQIDTGRQNSQNLGYPSGGHVDLSPTAIINWWSKPSIRPLKDN